MLNSQRLLVAGVCLLGVFACKGTGSRSNLASDDVSGAAAGTADLTLAVNVNKTITEDQPITSADVDSPTTVKLTSIPDDPASIKLLGLALGHAVVTLGMQDGSAKTLSVAVVPSIPYPSPDITLAVHVNKRITMSVPVTTARVDNETVVKPTSVPGDPTTVVLTGLSLGTCSVTLGMADGSSKTMTVAVASSIPYPAPDLTLAVNSHKILTEGQTITTAFVDNETILKVTAVAGDPTRIQLTGLAAGSASVTLGFTDGTTKTLTVAVQ